ncbi:tetratricopeptide repeat protein [Stigmatella sp. ncwal1]|uniref:Tetratricopeptide repeat protein n=1 Tax=Stigmatella ashevillensis TaxID=2995309 RepID=A0ABT5D150_9BACT|nr:tetratricopeptide repeat protein [Stigmatella ashevillena]MDC0707389.1 tetratricopeptide repeat protein [Stigmatella ashevillena]
MSHKLLATFNEGVTRSMAGDHQAALQAFDKVLSEDPNHSPALSAKGFSLARLGRAKEALPCFERAIELDPSSADNYRNAALCELELDEPESASLLFERAFQLNPETHYREAAAVEVFHLGQMLLTRGARRPDKARYRHARHAFELALGYHPSFIDAARALADAWSHLGDPEKSNHYILLAARLRPAG